MDPLIALQLLGAGQPAGGPPTYPSALALGAAQARLGLLAGPSGPVQAGLAGQQSLLGHFLLGLLLQLMTGQGLGAGGCACSQAGAGALSPPGGAGSGGFSPPGGADAGSFGSPSGTSGSSPTPGPSGAGFSPGNKVDPGQLLAYLEQRISRSRLNGFRPRDGARHGVDGSPRSWAQFMVKLAKLESNFNNSVVGDHGSFRGGSRGLFQLSYDDARNYGLNGGRPFTAAQLADPRQNCDAAVAIMERLVTRSGSITEGAGKYWGPIKRGKL